MSSNFKIRFAHPNDAADIASVNVLTWQRAYSGLMPEEHLKSLSIPERTLRWQNRFKNINGTTIIVAQHNERLVGFNFFGPALETPPSQLSEIYAIYVLPDYWGHGIGRALLEKSCDLLKKANYSESILWVLEGNTRAIRFYEKLGFIADGTVKADNRVPGFPLRDLRCKKIL